MPAEGDIPPIVIPLTVDASMAAEAIAEFKRSTKEGVEDATTTSVDRAKAKLDELQRKYQSVTEAINQQSRQVQDLQRARDQVSGSEQKQLDQQIETLSKKINRHSDELIALDKKRAKLEEIGAMANAQTEQERAGIRAATDARITELTVMQDQIIAQRGYAEEVEKTIPIGRNFFSVMGGWYVLNGLLSTAKSALAEVRQEMEGIGAAAEKLRSIVEGQFSKMKGFYDEFGLTDAAGQTAGKNAIDSIASSTNLTEDRVASTAAGLSSAMKGIPVGSQQFNDLVGNASVFAERGIDPSTMANFISDQLKQNPNLTGAQLNSALTGLTNLTGGSATRTNEFLGVLSEQARATGNNFNVQDLEKIFAQMSKNAPPQEVPNLMRSAFQGLNRLNGMSVDQREQLMDQLNEAGVGELNHLIGDSISHNKPLDPAAVSIMMGSMSPAHCAIAARMIGGPRNDVAMNTMAGWQNAQLPAGGFTGAPNSAVQTAASLQDQANIGAASRSPVDPFAAFAHTLMTNEQTWLQAHPEQQQGISHGWGRVGADAGTLGTSELLFRASPAEQAAANAYGAEYLKLARLLQTANPKQAAAIRGAMGGIYGQLFSRPGNFGTDQLQQFQMLQNGGADAQKFLDGIKDDSQWFRDNYQYKGVTTDIVDERKMAPLLREANQAEQSIVPKQSSMGPTIINQNRIVNYGMGFDSIGAPTSMDGNRYG